MRCEPFCLLTVHPMRRRARSTREALAARHSIFKQTCNLSRCFALLYFVSKGAERNSANTAQSVSFCVAICHDARKRWDLGYPATIFLAFKFNSKGIFCHRATITYVPAIPAIRACFFAYDTRRGKIVVRCSTGSCAVMSPTRAAFLCTDTIVRAA